MRSFTQFHTAINATHRHLKEYGTDVPVARWQGVPTEGTFREALFWSFTVPVGQRSSDTLNVLEDDELLDELRRQIQPNLPWADDHFLERVGGKPLNPGEQYKNWPFWTESDAATESAEISLHDGFFSHTYMERFWPHIKDQDRGFKGIRYRAGDLNDVVDLLWEDPYTRQAYVPIWFPEDTGARHYHRVPCTIGYFFIMRNRKLHMRYHIRSCDLTRYLRDDIYMAVRLMLWMLDRLRTRELSYDAEQLWVDVQPGEFHMDIDSLHIFGRDFATVSS